MTDSLYYERKNKNPGQGLFHFNATIVATLLILFLMGAAFVAFCKHNNNKWYIERTEYTLTLKGYTYSKVSYVLKTDEETYNYTGTHKLKVKDLRRGENVLGDSYVYITLGEEAFVTSKYHSELKRIEPIAKGRG